MLISQLDPSKLSFQKSAQKLESVEETRQIFNTPLLDYEEIGMPMDRWHFLFDPTGSQASAAGSGYQRNSKVVSVFSLGESSFREGTHSAKEASATANIDGSVSLSDHQIHLLQVHRYKYLALHK